MTTTSLAVSELAESLKPLMPDWDITAHTERRSNQIAAKLPEKGCLTLSVSPYGQPGRVVVRGEYPQQYGYECVAEITVALSRGPEALVKEIKRRLLPEYLPSYARAVERQKAAEEYQAKQDAALLELATVLGIEANNYRGSAYFYRDQISATVKDIHPDRANLELAVPLHLARQILELVVAATK